jgi:hypothetical protein
MKKLQKPKRLAQDFDKSTEGEPSKKRKLQNEDIWSCKPDFPEGETMYCIKNYAGQMMTKLVKKPKDVKLHRDFMDHTFALRRHDILCNLCPVADFLKKYLSLKQFVHVSTCTCIPMISI